MLLLVMTPCGLVGWYAFLVEVIASTVKLNAVNFTVAECPIGTSTCTCRVSGIKTQKSAVRTAFLRRDVSKNIPSFWLFLNLELSMDRLEIGGENGSVELFVYSETLPKAEHKNTNPEHRVTPELLLDLDSQYLVSNGMLKGS